MQSFLFTLLLFFTTTQFAFSQKTNATIPSFLVQLKEASIQPGIGLQSFAMGRWNNYVLLVGGRTNGFHGTDGTDSSINFPSSFSNTNFIVMQIGSPQVWTVPVPAPYNVQLSATNMQDCQSGNLLYLCGGYGKDSVGNYTTFSNLVCIQLDGLIPAIIANSPNLGQFIGQSYNSEMAVTGGELKTIGNYFYLVMGQNFQGLYTSPSSQTYTVQIKKFSITLQGTNTPVATLLQRYYDAGRTDSTSRFHRRDLNVVPVVSPLGTPGVTVYGGVFTPVTNGPYRAPVYIYQDAKGNTVVQTDTFKQKTNQYSCASIPIYDNSSKITAVTFIGGISLYNYKNYSNPKDVLKLDPAIPFTRNITTLLRLPGGKTYEIVTFPQNCLPAFIGAEAKFIPLPALLMNGSQDILDYSKIATNPGGTLIGYMFGGILSTAPQSSTINPTFINNKMYEVYITKRVPGGIMFK